MNNDNDLDPLKGKLYEIVDGEMPIPPRDFEVISEPADEKSFDPSKCNDKGCDDKMVVSEKGNQDYAWHYVSNISDQDAEVTIKYWWVYKGKWRSLTKRLKLYPAEERFVESMPRKQTPRCCIESCSLK